jgi:hypothetical protein
MDAGAGTTSGGNCTTQHIPLISHPRDTRVCGISSTNSTHLTALQTCCGGREFQTYRCAQYCTTTSDWIEFDDCLVSALGVNSSWISGSGLRPFCQEDSRANTTASLSSASTLARPIELRRLLLGCLVFFSLLSNGKSALLCHHKARCDTCGFRCLY